MIPVLAIPLAAKIAVATTLAAALFSFGIYIGHRWGVSSCYQATIESQAHAIEAGIQQAVVSDQTVTKYVDRVQIVKEKGRTIIKEIPIYVQDTCILSGGFRLLHDSAANSELPGPTRIADEKTVSVETVAQTVSFETATKTIFENYEACNVNSETLSSLQQWVREQSAIR